MNVEIWLEATSARWGSHGCQRRFTVRFLENSPNIENHVRKLPKPSSPAQGLLPLFEAVSNAFFAIDDRAETEAGHRGQVRVTVRDLSSMDKIQIVVSDDGIGLDDVRMRRGLMAGTRQDRVAREDLKRGTGNGTAGGLYVIRPEIPIKSLAYLQKQ